MSAHVFVHYAPQLIAWIPDKDAETAECRYCGKEILVITPEKPTPFRAKYCVPHIPSDCVTHLAERLKRLEEQ